MRYDILTIKENVPKKEVQDAEELKCDKTPISSKCAPLDNGAFPQVNVKRTATPLEDWWDSCDVKKRFNFSDRTLCTMRQQGKLPYAVVGGRCFYKAEDLKRLFDDSYNQHKLEMEQEHQQQELEKKQKNTMLNPIKKGTES